MDRLPFGSDPSADRDEPDDERFALALRMAFQPIAHGNGTLFAQEALVRGPGGEGAPFVLSRVTDASRALFDRAARRAAIETAARLGLGDVRLSLNFDPNAVHDPERDLEDVLPTLRRAGLRPGQLVFEIIEDVRPPDLRRLQGIVAGCRAMGALVALDDFGTMHSNLDQVAELRPDMVKADIRLVRGIDVDPSRRTIMQFLVRLCDELGILLVAEGVETPGEFRALADLGVTLFQGFLLGRPALDALTLPVVPATA
ncbi:MAG: EAL domain-containing protein [Gluconacetobacter diazotrophicus]|nr:EAL domain-containing protein [Gluconacetobacter diazotrophicus]